MRNNLERKLYQYGKESRQTICQNQNENMLGLMEHARKYETKNTMLDFALTNIGMIGKYCLMWQVIWLMGFLFVEMSKQITRVEFEVLLSVLPPLLVILTAEDISRVYNRSMLEIESTTKHSVMQIVMLRMSVLTVSNYFIVLMGIFILRSGLKGQLTELLLYGFTPMILAEAILIELMRHIKGEELKVAGFAVYAVIVSASVVMKLRTWNGFQSESVWIWQLILLLSVAWTFVGVIRLRKELSKYGISNKEYYEEV